MMEDPANWAANGPLNFTGRFYGFQTVDLVTFHGDGTGGPGLTCCGAWSRTRSAIPASHRGPNRRLD